MNQETMLKPAVVGGVLIGILSAVPGLNLGNCFCCAWVIAGGVLAAHLHVRASAQAVTLGTGVVLGLLTGAIGGIVETLFSIPILIAMRNLGVGVAEQVQRLLDQIPNLPAETKDAMRDMFQGGISVTLLVVQGIFTTVIFAAVAMLGGALGVALFEKRKPGPPSDVPPMPPYQPPGGVVPPPPPPAQAPPEGPESGPAS
jgi:uncharacterized protein YqgC (DUF456 family)